MLRPTRAAGTVASLLVTVAVLAACSSDGGGEAPASPSAPTSAAPSTSAPSSEASSESSSESSSGGDNDALEPALLPASDIGSGYRRTVSDTGDRDPLPCTPNEPPLVEQVPPQQYLGGTYRRSDQAIQVSENVFVFDDDAAAERYVVAARKGLACSSAKLEGATYRIADGGTFRTSTESDEARSWSLATTGYKGTLALVRLGEKVVAFTFVATDAAANELQPRAVVEKAVSRVDDTL